MRYNILGQQQQQKKNNLNLFNFFCWFKIKYIYHSLLQLILILLETNHTKTLNFIILRVLPFARPTARVRCLNDHCYLTQQDHSICSINKRVNKSSLLTSRIYELNIIVKFHKLYSRFKVVVVIVFLLLIRLIACFCPGFSVLLQISRSIQERNIF